MNIIECDRKCSNVVEEILNKVMSWFHAYYATSCIDAGVCRALVAYEGGAVGAGVFYSLPRLGTGVVYYVAVLPGHRGRGVGRAIVASIEEILEGEGVKVFVATTRRENVASRRMLTDLNYLEINLEKVDRALEELITMMTCGYEDDVLYVKAVGLSLSEFFHIVSRRSSVEAIEKVWRRVCYSPWKRLRGA